MPPLATRWTTLPSSDNIAATIPALEADGLCISWDGTPIVEDVSLSLAPGELVCLVGRSGAGKTTLFHTLAGLTSPDAGRVLLHGEDVTGVPGHVSYMLQKDLLLESRTVMGNVCLPLVLAGTPMGEARAKAEPLLERFGLAGTADLWPAQLSGGMRQRAALLRTYLMDNDMILLDEPFSALDAITRAEMRDWFCGIVSELGLTALVITHDVDEATILANRVFVLAGSPQDGRASRIVGEVSVGGVPSERGAEFDLCDEFLAAKREVCRLLR